MLESRSKLLEMLQVLSPTMVVARALNAPQVAQPDDGFPRLVLSSNEVLKAAQEFVYRQTPFLLRLKLPPEFANPGAAPGEGDIALELYFASGELAGTIACDDLSPQLIDAIESEASEIALSLQDTSPGALL